MWGNPDSGIRDYGIWNPGNFCLWNPESWALEYSSRSPESHQRLEYRIQNPLTNTVIQYLEFGIHGVESIPRLSWIPLHGAKNLLMLFINTVTGYEAGLCSSRTDFYIYILRSVSGFTENHIIF